jgi:hypothetical protein
VQRKVDEKKRGFGVLGNFFAAVYDRRERAQNCHQTRPVTSTIFSHNNAHFATIFFATSAATPSLPLFILTAPLHSTPLT